MASTPAAATATSTAKKTTAIPSNAAKKINATTSATAKVVQPAIAAAKAPAPSSPQKTVSASPAPSSPQKSISSPAPNSPRKSISSPIPTSPQKTTSASPALKTSTPATATPKTPAAIVTNKANAAPNSAVPKTGPAPVNSKPPLANSSLKTPASKTLSKSVSVSHIKPIQTPPEKSTAAKSNVKPTPTKLTGRSSTSGPAGLGPPQKTTTTIQKPSSTAATTTPANKKIVHNSSTAQIKKPTTASTTDKKAVEAKRPHYSASSTPTSPSMSPISYIASSSSNNVPATSSLPSLGPAAEPSSEPATHSLFDSDVKTKQLSLHTPQPTIQATPAQSFSPPASPTTAVIKRNPPTTRTTHAASQPSPHDSGPTSHPSSRNPSPTREHSTSTSSANSMVLPKITRSSTSPEGVEVDVKSEIYETEDDPAETERKRKDKPRSLSIVQQSYETMLQLLREQLEKKLEEEHRARERAETDYEQAKRELKLLQEQMERQHMHSQEEQAKLQEVKQELQAKEEGQKRLEEENKKFQIEKEKYEQELEKAKARITEQEEMARQTLKSEDESRKKEEDPQSPTFIRQSSTTNELRLHVTVKCRDLFTVGFSGQCDPVVGLFDYDQQNRRLYYLSQTEWVRNNSDPNFETQFDVNYIPGQTYRFNLYHISTAEQLVAIRDSAKKNVLGYVEVKSDDLLEFATKKPNEEQEYVLGNPHSRALEMKLKRKNSRMILSAFINQPDMESPRSFRMPSTSSIARHSSTRNNPPHQQSNRSHSHSPTHSRYSPHPRPASAADNLSPMPSPQMSVRPMSPSPQQSTRSSNATSSYTNGTSNAILESGDMNNEDEYGHHLHHQNNVDTKLSVQVSLVEPISPPVVISEPNTPPLPSARSTSEVSDSTSPRNHPPTHVHDSPRGTEPPPEVGFSHSDTLLDINFNN